jgi:hypothetical protein
MVENRNKQTLRIVGIFVWLCGLFLPWFRFDFEPHSYPVTELAGWEEILISFGVGIEYLTDGFAFDVAISLLEGVSIVFLAAYIISAILAFKRKTSANRGFSILLAGILTVNIFYAQVVTNERILFGFWVFIAGLLVCLLAESINR